MLNIKTFSVANKEAITDPPALCYSPWAGADLDSRFICHKQRIIVPSVRDLQAMAEAL
jgi:hypothetical protein